MCIRDRAGAYQRLQPEDKRVARIDVAQVEDIVAKICLLYTSRCV